MPISPRANCRTQRITNIKKLVQIKEAKTPIIEEMTFYTHNMSGIKHKIYNFNNSLSQQIYDVYAIQETWLNSSVTDPEIIGAINYSIIRSDRSCFSSNRKTGGGVMMFINNKFKHTQVEISIRIILEIQIVEIILPSSSLLIINLYMPPNRARLTMVKELNRILNHVHTDFPSLGIILLGDFNAPNSIWEALPNEVNLNLINDNNLPPSEKRLFQSIFAHGLLQINSIPNSRGTYLDLIFTNVNHNYIARVPPSLQIDADGTHHRAITFSIPFTSCTTPDELPTAKLNYATTKHKKAQLALNAESLPLLNNGHIQYYYTKDESQTIQNIDQFTKNLRKIQDRFTGQYKQQPQLSKHPWTRDKNYAKLVAQKLRAKRQYTIGPTPANADKLKKCHIETYQLYNHLKEKFYSNILVNTRGNTMDFYNIMRTKRRINTVLLIRDGVKFFGNDRFDVIGDQLTSCFSTSSIDFSSVHTTRYLQLEEIYDRCFTNQFSDKWTNYDDDVSIDEIIGYINTLDSSKDPGPMSIPQIFCVTMWINYRRFYNAKCKWHFSMGYSQIPGKITI